jgi:hypothetical protein
LLNFTIQLSEDEPADNITGIAETDLQLVLQLLRARAMGNLVYQTFIATEIVYHNASRKREYPI